MKKYSTFGKWFCAVSGTEIPHCSFQHNLFLQLFLFFPFLLSDCLIWPEKDTTGNDKSKSYLSEMITTFVTVDGSIWPIQKQKQSFKVPFHAQETYCSE